jgi:ribosomal subunit interface protein
MDLHLAGRGTRITDDVRATCERKLARLERIEPRLTRVDVEVIAEHNPRQGGAHRIEVVAVTPRKTYRAHGDAADVEAALDVVVGRVERQIRDHHQKKRTRLLHGARRAVTSAHVQGVEGAGETG